MRVRMLGESRAHTGNGRMRWERRWLDWTRQRDRRRRSRTRKPPASSCCANEDRRHGRQFDNRCTSGRACADSRCRTGIVRQRFRAFQGASLEESAPPVTVRHAGKRPSRQSRHRPRIRAGVRLRRRMRMWILAIAVAIVGTAALQAYGLIDTGKSIYTSGKVPWLSHVVGGFLFGFGMTLASGCGSKTLIRAGAGNLKSVIVLVFLAAAAYMTLKGVFAPWRANGLDTVRWDVGAKASDLPTLAIAAGLAAATRLWLPLIVAGALLVFIFANRDFRSAPELIIGGLVVGAVIVGGWYVSGHLGYLPEDPQTLEEKFVATNSGRLESFSFVAPSAYLLELLLLWTDQSRVVTFGIAGVLGMLLGSAAMA